MKVGQWYLRLLSAPSVPDKAFGVTNLDRPKAQIDQGPIHLVFTLYDQKYKMDHIMRIRYDILSPILLYSS